jgi:hypothetical protein
MRAQCEISELFEPEMQRRRQAFTAVFSIIFSAVLDGTAAFTCDISHSWPDERVPLFSHFTLKMVTDRFSETSANKATATRNQQPRIKTRL